MPALQIQRIGARIGGPRLRRGAAEQLDLEFAGHRCGDLVLHREDVAQVAIEGLRPDVRAVAARISCAVMRIREPDRRTLPSRRCATLSSRAISAAPSRPSLEGERRGARDDAQALHARQQVEQVLRQAVREVLVRLVLAQVGERQDGYRALGRRRPPAMPFRRWRFRGVRRKRVGGRQPAGRFGRRGFTPDPFRRDLVQPGKEQRKREADQEQHEDEFQPPGRHLEHLEQQLGDLQQHPRGDGVQDRRLDHLAAPEFGEETHQEPAHALDGCRMTPEGGMSSTSPGLPSSRLRPTIPVVLRTIASCRAHQDCCRASRWAWPCSWPRPVRCCIHPVMRVSRRITPVCTRSSATPACRSRRSSRWPAVRARCPCCPPAVVAFLVVSAIVSLVERAVPRAFQSRAPPRQ